MVDYNKLVVAAVAASSNSYSSIKYALAWTNSNFKKSLILAD